MWPTSARITFGNSSFAKSSASRATPGVGVPVRPSPEDSTNTPGSRKAGTGNALKNRILNRLPDKEWNRISPSLTLVTFKLHDLLQEAGKPIEYCYFPNTMMASVLNVMIHGESVEVGLRGWEGFVGLPAIAGFRTNATRVITQGEGTAFRIPTAEMTKILASSPVLSLRLLRYSQEVMMEVTQVAACNRLHEVDQRLARWLLMSQDRICSEILPLTHEFLAQMLATRRASVSVAAGALQKIGLIKYQRGRIEVLNRKGLERASCECYAAIRNQLSDWQNQIG
jgi:CRP-like cAMP-binding protein